MSNDNIERRIEFIIEQQARFSIDIDQLKEVQSQQAQNVNSLIDEMREGFNNLKEVQAQQAQNINSLIDETREGFNNLIVANEVTRNLAEQATKLAIQNSHRITNIEEKHNGQG